MTTQLGKSSDGTNCVAVPERNKLVVAYGIALRDESATKRGGFLPLVIAITSPSGREAQLLLTSRTSPRHREARSAVAIQTASRLTRWIASPAARNDGTGDDASLRGSVVCDRGNLADMSTVAEAPSSHMTDLSCNVMEASDTRSDNDPAWSNTDPPGGQNMTPKEYTVEGKLRKEHSA